ncbi:MAG: hypothetical protein K6E73_07290 [Bacteroidales bacterium]|nr:hypothetical protein [Bacteroidales bacterium]
MKIKKLVLIIGNNEMSIKDMMKEAALKDRENFMDGYLNPAIKDNFVCMLYPDSPRHPRQKYLLTAKGMALYSGIKS